MKQDKCKVTFYPAFCVIQDSVSQTIGGIGKAQSGLYYLLNIPLKKVHSEFKKISQSLAEVGRRDETKVEVQVAAERRGNNSGVNHVARKKNDYVLWHNRLGHAPMNKLKMIECISNTCVKTDDVCLTCPMAKFTKLPYSLSDSTACLPFELVHIDIWGPYKACRREKYRYFLSILDDYTSRINAICCG